MAISLIDICEAMGTDPDVVIIKASQNPEFAMLLQDFANYEPGTKEFDDFARLKLASFFDNDDYEDYPDLSSDSISLWQALKLSDAIE